MFQLSIKLKCIYLSLQLACTVMAGLLHFFIVASFVWMLLEALQLHLLVRKLSQVQVIRRDGLPRPILYLVGYGVPFVIVGVSALIYSDGYGVTSNVCVTHNYFHIFPCDQCFSRTGLLDWLFIYLFTWFFCRCFLSTKRNFNWALTGPIIAILAVSTLSICSCVLSV